MKYPKDIHFTLALFISVVILSFCVIQFLSPPILSGATRTKRHLTSSVTQARRIPPFLSNLKRRSSKRTTVLVPFASLEHDAKKRLKSEKVRFYSWPTKEGQRYAFECVKSGKCTQHINGKWEKWSGPEETK